MSNVQIFGMKNRMVANARYGIACCHCLAGSEPEALIALEEAIVAGFSSAAHRRHIESDTALDGVRQSDEFQRILRMTDAEEEKEEEEEEEEEDEDEEEGECKEE